MAGKSLMTLAFKQHSRRYKEPIAPATTLEGLRSLIQQRRYNSRHA
jgi:hypothetical protein